MWTLFFEHAALDHGTSFSARTESYAGGVAEIMRALYVGRVMNADMPVNDFEITDESEAESGRESARETLVLFAESLKTRPMDRQCPSEDTTARLGFAEEVLRSCESNEHKTRMSAVLRRLNDLEELPKPFNSN
jgi:hypothetical protein